MDDDSGNDCNNLVDETTPEGDFLTSFSVKSHSQSISTADVCEAFEEVVPSWLA